MIELRALKSSENRESMDRKITYQKPKVLAPLYFILSFLLLTLLSFFISFLITNWKVLKLPTSERNIEEISLSEDQITYQDFNLNSDSLEISGDNPSIKIDLNEKYIEKFNYSYEIENNVDVEIILTEKNSYGEYLENLLSDRLLADIDISSISIRNNVKTIELKFQGESLRITGMNVDNRIKFNPYIFLFVFMLGLIICITLLLKEQILGKVENIFLLVAATTGLLFVFLLPNHLGLSWDDEIHFQTVYSLPRRGEVEWTKSPLDLVNNNPAMRYFTFLNTPEERSESNKYLNLHHDYSKIIISEEKTTSWDYNTLLYSPSAIAFKVPDLIGLPFTISFLISKLANLFTYILVIYFAIKIIPIFKRGLAYIALLPGAIFLAGQFSCDPLTTAFFFLAIAILVKIILSDKPMNWKDISLFVISTIIASSAKAVYLPLLLLPLFLNKDRFKDSKARRWIITIILIAFLLILSYFVLPRITGSISMGDPRGGDTSPMRQLSLFINQPFSFIKVLLDNVSSNFFNKFVGIGTIGHFAYVGQISSFNLYYLSLFFLSFFSITDSYNQNSTNKISAKFKLLFICTTLVITMATWLLLYIDFTPVGSTTINGVQGRYFIPLLPLLFLTINSPLIKTNIPEKYYNLILLISSTFILFGSIYLMILKPYCF